MQGGVIAQIRALQRMTVAELQVRWRELYGEDSRSRNRDFLIKRLCWRVQELARGGLSDRARSRIVELAPDAFVRAQVPRGAVPETLAELEAVPRSKTVRDPRLPTPGSVITRKWRGRDLRLVVLEDGFELDGARYASLSEAARAVTGQRWNGPLYWGLRDRKRSR